MKKLQYVFLLFAFALMGYSSGLHAEDTDLYVANATNRGTPNVLLVIDNGASFDANASIGCTGYLDGSGPPSTGTSNTAGVLQCALVNAIQSLQDDAVRIGIMVSNANSFAETQATTNPSLGGYHELCAGGGLGGCLLRPLTLMDAKSGAKASLISFIKGWKTTGQSDANGFGIKVNSSYQAETMQEAWAYFSAKTGISGKTYTDPILTAGCQGNIIIYISNTQKNPNSNEYKDAQTALSAPQVGATADQLKEITGSINFTPPICGGSGNSTLYTLTTGNNLADEWARLMKQLNAGAQNVLTYSIGIESSSSQCSPDTFGLMASMANVGGGEFFRVSSVNDLSDALNKILNQAQAENSVFSSASLPVSVNADGSYLNQIYLGMFRPDAKASPRWLGNLKQYHLIRNDAGALVQGDARPPDSTHKYGYPAINPLTGFIDPSALSFWTSKNTGTLPDSAGGFWKNALDSQGTGSAKSPYDYVDGEVVEKGGVSQQLRLESITANYSSTPQTSSNPRRMYVHCPDGSATCLSDPAAKDLTVATNQFSTANSTIPSNAFGSDSIVPINAIIRSGTTALVSTSGNHGFKAGTVVTISGAAQPEYNVTQTLNSSTVNSSTTFTLTGLPDYPASPSQGTYTIGPPVSGTTVNITSMSRATHTSGGYNTETVTVNTDVAGGFTTTSNLTITGASPSVYNYSGSPTSVSGTQLTFDVAVTPTAPAVNGYVVQLAPTTYTARSVTLTNPVAGEIDGTTSVVHGLHAGQQVVITGASVNSKYAGTYTLASASGTTFTITSAGNAVKNLSGESGTVRPDTTAKAIVTLTRDGTTDSTSARATGLPANWFGTAANDTAVVNVSLSSGSAGNESAYVVSAVTATCANAGCTTLTYPITVSPSSNITLNSAKVGPQSVTTAVLPAGRITRSGTTVTVTGPFVDSKGSSVLFTNGQILAIAASGAALASEDGYLGTWTISCTSCASSFTLTRTDGSTVTLTPRTPATGVSMTAYAAGTPPDRDTLIRWVRGEDNFGGENGPGSPITVRPSIHGDVLHSRPVVINYGDTTRGIVVFYGSNDGVFRAVNGAQTTGNINGVPPGGELWGLVFPEHFAQFNRLRQDSPELKFPSTTLASARPKDYFADGQPSSYQLTKADGTIDKAWLFITVRRGGRFIYALDVTNPVAPKVMWKKSSADAGFAELGQTWSRPRTTLVQGGGLGTSPMLVFGAGYDPAEDKQAPGTDTMGRGIYILNAATGDIIWSASPSCGTSTATCLNVPGMQWAVPSDMAFVDRDGNGYTDKVYFGDMGGNLWRADIAAASTSNWTLTKVGALGCDEGTPSTSTHLCANGTAPRKFFFPPAVLAVKPAGATGSFDAISIPSGDREHPLKEDTNPVSAYNVVNRFFMINDLGTQVITDPANQTGALPTQNVTQASLFNATSAPYDATAAALDPTGFYITFTTGEKGVNAPLATNGLVFFATNQPTPPDTTCGASLGKAIAYAVSPFLGTASSNVIVGGGLPPSPVAGLINIVTKDSKGNDTVSQERFCIGCAAQCTSCSALENSPPVNVIPKNVKRTYWYKK